MNSYLITKAGAKAENIQIEKVSKSLLKSGASNWISV